ncbi:sodium/solute symporter [Leptospira ellisii]|uniref:Sodium/solute symporter n=1 Tax=Leptospira ellisii TaxID=2023197 RepID=A0AAE4QR64_9LEPT|nr:sodium/solute symporter [Leptospira ellisii]MDV6237257.1 sodium/solute symporter [Leptospira ellisii]
MFTLIDGLFFLITILIVLGIGIYAGRKEDTSEDYFLGGRSLPWWGVAGSLFGTNVSANHIVGMLGIGYSVGFAQSHFMFGAIPALLLLSYVLLPAYRRKRIFTLSQYLESRYGESVRFLYSGIVMVLIAIQLAAGLYIGSRSLLPFLRDLGWNIGYGEGVILLALISTVYTWFGGLKAVVYTDVIQSVFILAAGLLLAYLTLNHPDVGGWEGLLQRESSLSEAERRMTFFLPSDHGSLPWTGALSGLFILHAFYWGTNQYVVQRTLGASSLRQARAGILGDGFLTLIIPFFTVLTGVAAYHLFSVSGKISVVDPDEAFSKLIAHVVPSGYGFGGIILAGLLGAIFSSVDSLLNSASTLFTIDYYAPWRRSGSASRFFSSKEMGEAESVRVGRAFLLLFSAFTVLLALFAYDPFSKGNFFLELSAQSSHLTPGILVVFLTGIFWKKADRTSAAVTILLCPLISVFSPHVYEYWSGFSPGLISMFGTRFNYLHRVFAVSLICLTFHVVLSSLLGLKEKKTTVVETNERRFLLTYAGISAGFVWIVICFLIRFYGRTSGDRAGIICGVGIFLLFGVYALRDTFRLPRSKRWKGFLKNHDWIAGILSGLTVFSYFYFS